MLMSRALARKLGVCAAKAELNWSRNALPSSSGLTAGWIQPRRLDPAKQAEDIPSLGAVSPA